jgi:hypothetical protein
MSTKQAYRKIPKVGSVVFAKSDPLSAEWWEGTSETFFSMTFFLIPHTGTVTGDKMRYGARASFGVRFNNGLYRWCPIGEITTGKMSSILDIQPGALICARWAEKEYYREGTVISVFLNRDQLHILFTDGVKARRMMSDVRLVVMGKCKNPMSITINYTL